MQSQTFKLSLKPNDHPPRVPVVFANQYDVGRPFAAEIYDVDGSAYTFTDETVTVQGTKPSGTGFSIPATCSGNTASFTTTGQMTVVHGFVRCGILITKGDVVVGTLAFLLYVQQAALEAETIIDSDDFGSIISDSVAEYMEEHGIVIDPTLTVSGAAADAKATGDAVNDLKSNIDDIGEYVNSKNILNQDGTVVEGKYLNPNSGAVSSNSSYFYIEDYFPVEGGTSYTPSMTNKTTGTQNLGIQTFLVFYNSNHEYISGLENTPGTFTTPSNAAYLRWSASNNQKATNNFQIEKGTSATPYQPYHNKWFVTNFTQTEILVDKNGNGMFTTVTDAVSCAVDGDTIYIKNGVYDNEEISAWGKAINIVGESKNGVIIKNGLNTYSRPPLEFSAGTLRNLTILAYDGGGASLDQTGWKSYAIHMDNSHSANKHILIENCDIISEGNAGIGIGLWANETVEINNCNLVGVSNKGGMYCHDNASADAAGAGKLICHNCTFSNTLTNMFGLQLQSYNMTNTAITAEFINCSANPRPVYVATSGEVAKVSLLERWTVSPLSFGNKYSTLEQ